MAAGRNDSCWCGSGKKWKKCHYPQEGQKLYLTAQEYLKRYKIVIKNEREIQHIRKACLLTAGILKKTAAMAQEGITTHELNEYAHKLHLEAGAKPAPLHYGFPPYPKSICTSLNEVICHGIPDHRPLQKGDILNIDVSCNLNGYFGDCSRMVVVGETTHERKLVVDTAYECLMKGIAALKPGNLLCEIGNAIEKHAKSKNCSVVHQFVGHGVGLKFHEAPQVCHYHNNSEIPLGPGMIFTIEPMINAGVPEAIIDDKDHWTARTADGKASAQWEHTLLITETGYEILTPWE